MKNLYTKKFESSNPQRIKTSWEDALKGGLADKKKPEDFDKKQLSKGIKVEMEHTNDEKKAKEIAMDHLTEDEKYYDKLAKIENKHKT